MVNEGDCLIFTYVLLPTLQNTIIVLLPTQNSSANCGQHRPNHLAIEETVVFAVVVEVAKDE